MEKNRQTPVHKTVEKDFSHKKTRLNCDSSIDFDSKENCLRNKEFNKQSGIAPSMYKNHNQSEDPESITSNCSENEGEQSELSSVHENIGNPFVRKTNVDFLNSLDQQHYYPEQLENMFDNKLKELRPFLIDSIDDDNEKLRTLLESICKDFLDILMESKPIGVKMHHYKEI